MSQIKKEIKLYKENHKKSLKLWQKANQIIPGGVSHNIRDFNMNFFDLGPPFIKQAKDSKLFDVDNNSYIDFWVTHGAAILGHAYKPVIDAITKQLPKGNHYGMVNEETIKLAERIIEATPSIEELRFCTTGTEATMYTSRLARAYTGKRLIVKVRGGWHGGNDTLFYFVSEVEKGMESEGIRTQEEAGILSFDYNDIEGFREIIKKHKQDIAAVIMEPVLGAGGAIPPKEGFLEHIREETIENDILLIFDEIITGFRLDYHSAQGYFGVHPDLTTMGKIVGGGAPIGVIGGRKDLLEQANRRKGGNVWIGGGTFSSNPVSMVAGNATLKALKEGGKNLYNKLNSQGEKIRKELREIVEKHDAPAFATGVGSMISLHWFKEKLSKLNSGTEVKLNLNKEKISLFQLLLFNRNVLIRGGFGYLCIKHTDEEIEKTLKAMDESIEILMRKD